MTNQRILRLKYQLQQSRLRLSAMDDKFKDLLYNILFVATKKVTRISTNGHCIYFDPDFIQPLGDHELDFILAHQLMHIILDHIHRPEYYIGDRFHLACDIIVNSRLEAYGWREERLPRIGKIFTVTFFPRRRGDGLTPEEAFQYVPFDPATLKDGKRRGYMIDSESAWDLKDDRGEFGIIVLKPEDEDPELRETQEEENDCRLIKIYTLTPPSPIEVDPAEEQPPPGEELGTVESSDPPDPDKLVAKEVNRLRQERANNTIGAETLLSERIWCKQNAATLNWKTLLNSFIQQEICDYSFTPPDRRLSESEFFLPDFNVTSEHIDDILFMVDTSASIKDEALAAVYGEIASALSILNDGLNGIIGFFDTKVYGLQSVKTCEELDQIVPKGNGATDFDCIFKHVKTKMSSAPACIVIFTDGDANFPNQAAANGIPVLWLLTNRAVDPPWGSVAYM